MFFSCVDFQISWTVDKMGEILEPGTVIRPQMDADCAQHLLLRCTALLVLSFEGTLAD
jgi:hypothetical protein